MMSLSCIVGNNIEEMIKVRLSWENLFGNGLEIKLTVKKLANERIVSGVMKQITYLQQDFHTQLRNLNLTGINSPHYIVISILYKYSKNMNIYFVLIRIFTIFAL